jgi:uncharacterized protein involved in exopolysaccharide biosynthesis
MKESEINFSLEPVEILYRHAWLFICPVIIIMSVAYAYVMNSSLYYESKAVLSFESRRLTGEASRSKEDLVGKLLFGKSIRSIIKETWPALNEEAEPLKYNRRLEALRAPRTGIQIKSESDPRLLTISFVNQDPNICYRVVKSTVDAIIRENKYEIEMDMENSLLFLTKQVELYKDKMEAAEKEISRLKTELKDRFPELNEAERNLVRELTREASATEAVSSVTKSVKYDEMLTELNLQLLEAQKKKERLEKGEFLPQPDSTQSFETDPSVQEYNKAIAAKEFEIVRLSTEGCTPEHPDIKKLQNEIDMLRKVKENRLAALSGATSTAYGSAQKKEILKAQLEDFEFQIEALKDKINLIEQYAKTAKEQVPEIQDKALSEKAARLIELRNEKEIASTYFTQLSRQREELALKIRSEKAEVGFNISVIEAPKVPLKPVPFQRVSKLFMGLILALGTGGSLAYIADFIGNSIKTTAELREFLQIPILASIDRMITLQEIKSRRKRRKVIIISLVVFVILSNILIRLWLHPIVLR